MHSLSLLTALFSDIEAGSEIRPAVRTWLLRAKESLATGESGTLDSALGLDARPGVAKVGTRYRKSLRDDILLDLLDQRINQGLTPWPASVAVSQAISQFKSCTWPRISHSQNSPARLTPEQKTIWQLFRIDRNLPASPSFLHGLLSLRQPPLLPVVKPVNTLSSQTQQVRTNKCS